MDEFEIESDDKMPGGSELDSSKEEVDEISEKVYKLGISKGYVCSI